MRHVGDVPKEHTAPAVQPLMTERQWRWRWDLNPRRTCALTRFRGVLLRPLGHATAEEATGASVASMAGEEGPQHLAALGLQHAAYHLWAVVEPPVADDIPQ